MKSLPTGMSATDIGQWLNHGWFLFKADKDSPAELGQLQGGGEDWTVRGLDGEMHNMVTKYVFPTWPLCGAVNTERGFAVYIQRVQARQYRRTYNIQCVDMTVPRKWDIMKRFGTEIMADLTPDTGWLVERIFNPQYYTFTEAYMRMSGERWVSVAINSHLMISGSPDDFAVYYRNDLVGTVTNGRLTPIGASQKRLGRIIKFFDGRVTL